MEHLMMGEGRPSQGQGQGQPARRLNPIRPVTIKQILQANTEAGTALVVDGRELTQATVAGRVVGYESAQMSTGGALTAKHFGYKVTDNTGLMVVRQWVEAESPEEPISMGSHVRASGTVKVWQGVPVVTGSVVAMADTNELNYHMLDAILTHLRLTRGIARRPSAGGAVANTASALGVQNLLPGGAEKVSVTDLVIHAIKSSNSGDMGLHLDEIIRQLSRYNCDPVAVRVALRTLAEEGRVYETHDNRFNI